MAILLDYTSKLKNKPGYKKENEITWRGTDIFNLISALELLDQGAGSGEDLEQTLIMGDDANGLSITNLTNLEVAVITDTGGVGLTLSSTGPLNVNGSDVINISTINNINLQAEDVDMSAINGVLRTGALGLCSDIIADSTGGGIAISSNVGFGGDATATSPINCILLNSYADNAAAIVGNLGVGDFYRNSVTNAVSVVV